MTATPTMTVVIPCRNVATTLPAQLEALVRQDVVFPWEVVVVDNGSSDDTVAVATSFADRLNLRLVDCPDPGINRARNAGVRAAAAQHIAICDGDDVVGDGWVNAMGMALGHHTYVTGPVELDLLNPPELAASRGRSSANSVPRFGDAFRYARGCNFGVHRSVLERVGWFDENTPCLDDQELGLRMHLAGVPLHFEPRAVVHYRYRAGARAIWRQGFFYGSARVPMHLEATRAGLDAPSRFAGWRSWAWLLLHLPSARTRAGRLALLWVLANRVGQLYGSARWRTVFV